MILEALRLVEADPRVIVDADLYLVQKRTGLNTLPLLAHLKDIELQIVGSLIS